MLPLATRLRLRRLHLHTSRTQLSSLSSSQVRREFIRYFEDRDHQHVPSSSVVPDDESLLFTTAGMNQFKSIFLGNGAEIQWNGLQRAVSYQKCIRAGGKHNDLDDVGKDCHHQTFFEMLGNWSFNGAYSKEHACRMAWSFLIEVMKIDADRLYVSYFGGDRGIPADEECKEIWRRIGVPSDRILPFKEENFWEMGFVGPCGMCTEIHYDRVPGRGNVSHLVNRDASVVELWNIVFMCLNRGIDGSLKALPSEHIDTGMGLERLVSVVQGVDSNFDTDLFHPIIQKLTLGSPLQYDGTLSEKDAAFRLVADHVRAATVAISDGAVPSGSQAGFVVRKMLRRAFWQSSGMLGMDRGALPELIPLIANTLKSGYPSLVASVENIQRAIADDEAQFWKIVDKGKKSFNDMIHLVSKEAKLFPGELIWTLHDTHGVPLEVTAELAKAAGKELDLEGFEKRKEEAKNISKRASSFTAGVQLDPSCYSSQSDDAKYNYTVSATGDYEFPSIPAKVLSLFESSGKGYARVPRLTGKGALVLEDCQFYAEEGGQKYDEGVLLDNEENVLFVVENVQKVRGITVLYGSCNALIEEGAVLAQKIDTERRCALMRTHSATHLLNWALRRVGCGEGQRGSSVGEDALRFDYAVGENAGEEGIMEEVEKSVLAVISAGRQVFLTHLPLATARSLRQLQSEFKENKIYPSEVRVITVGSEDVEVAVAAECCSGTHVLNTKDIGDFCITGDRSSAKGVRRVTALCGPKAAAAREYSTRLLEELQKGDGGSLAALREKIDWSLVPCSMNKTLNLLLKKQKSKRVRA